MCEKVNIPIIACGGVSEWSHLKDGLEKSNVDAVAAANIFHYQDQSVYLAKKFLHDNQMNVRKPDLIRLWKKWCIVKNVYIHIMPLR